MANQDPHRIVIIGGNFGGINVAHYLLRNTLPALKAAHPGFNYKVTLVTPNIHFYFKIAAPRVVVQLEKEPDEELFPSIPENFVQYGGLFEFVQGKAVGLEEAHPVVAITSGEKHKEIIYDSLVLATGTSLSSSLWTGIVWDDPEASKAEINQLHWRLSKAGTVLVAAGAGPFVCEDGDKREALAIELASEVAIAYPNARVTLAAADERLLPRLPPSLSEETKKALEALDVTIEYNLQVSDSRAMTTNVGVMFSGTGRSMNFKAFVDATGPFVMNTAWLPKAWLDKKGHILTRDKYFRIQGGSGNIYAVGDIVVGKNATANDIDAMVVTVASSIAFDINEGLGGSDAASSTVINSSYLEQQEFRPTKDTIIIPIGSAGGVGQIHGWSTPSFSAENLLQEFVEPLITGKKWDGQ